MKKFKNKNDICFFFTYLTNFKPNNFDIMSNTNKFKHFKKNRIICRNFFLFILLLKYFNNKINSKSCMWIKPLKQKNITLLRAPYRYKLSRQQITITRYFIFYKLTFNFKNNFYLDTIKNCINFTNSLKKFNI